MNDQETINQDSDFIEGLKKSGQLVDIMNNTTDEEITQLPARVTHVRYPDGRIKRIRFNMF